MRRSALLGLSGLVTLLLAAAPTAAQQAPAPEPSDSARRAPAVLALGPVPAASLLLRSRAAAPVGQPSLSDRLNLAPLRQRSRGGHALIGGLIGTAAGIVVCTAISNYAKDPGTGFSTCTTSGYLAFGAGGFAVGALVGYLIK